jgi:hypothetical protein
MWIQIRIYFGPGEQIHKNRKKLRDFMGLKGWMFLLGYYPPQNVPKLLVQHRVGRWRR